MTVSRVVAVWTGWSGGPGFTSFHFLNLEGAAQTGVDAVHRFMSEAFAQNPDGSPTLLPGALTININVDVEHYDEETGVLTGLESTTEPAPISGGGADPWSAAVGICASWSTPQIHQGRRIRGRTFLVPHLGCDSNSGTISVNGRDAVARAGQELIDSGPGFVIWSRPDNGTGGALGVVGGVNVPAASAVLRSRRD